MLRWVVFYFRIDGTPILSNLSSKLGVELGGGMRNALRLYRLVRALS